MNMGRRKLRENVFRLIFCCDFFTEEELAEQVDTYMEEENLGGDDEDVSYIKNRVREIMVVKRNDIDKIIEKNAEGWSFERIGTAEKAILRQAVYELLYDETVPGKVAINEAVELSHSYCDDKGPAFINGVLSGVLKSEGIEL